MSSELMRLKLPATLQSIRELRKRLDYTVQSAGVAKTSRSNLTLALAEIASNVVRHATPPATTLELRFIGQEQAWILEVWDDGGGFVDLPQRMAGLDWKVGDVDLLESGMGLALIGGLCSHHEYSLASDTSAGLNCFRVRMDETIKIMAKPQIVLLDDDRALSAVLAEYLSEKYDVHVFFDGETAMASLQSQPIDLIISDIRMPGMDGFQFREHIGKQAKLEMTPFIFLTGYEKLEWQNRAAHMGIDDYLIKPVSKASLLLTVNRVLERSRKLKVLMGDRLDKKLTAALRPALPKQLGLFRLEIRTRSASAGGGDFVFQRSLGAAHLLLLGDIMGHGEDAKFFAHAHAGYFLGMMEGANAPDSPESALRFLSQSMEKDSIMAATLVTCLAINLNPDASLTVACAGHPPPIILSAAGQYEVDVGGVLPGLLPDASYEEQQIRLGQQERLLLYTDGLFESAMDGQGRDVLRKTLLDEFGRLLNQPLADAADAVVALFDKTAGLSPKDDATFIVLEMT